MKFFKLLLFLFCLLPIVVNADLQNSLIFRVQLDEGTGTTIGEETSTWTCTASDASWVTDGTYGDVYVSTATNDINCGDQTFGGGDFTWSCWVHPTTINSFNVVFSKYVTSAGARSAYWQLDGDDDIQLIVSSDGTANETESAIDVGIVIDTWYNVIVVFDDGIYDVFIDDGAAETVTADFTSQTSVHDGTASLLIGSRAGANGFVGRMRECAVWNRILTSAERTEVFNDQWGDSSAAIIRRRKDQ